MKRATIRKTDKAMKQPAKPSPRKHRKTISLNDSELAALENYCRRYRVKNQSALIRETIFGRILEHFQSDYPTLWPARELALLEK